MGYGWQHTRRVNDMFQRFQGPTCTSNYINTKNEIEQKINTFNYKDPNSYCRRCNEIKKNITEKTGELQYCYGITKFQRIEDTDKIKEFINKCPNLHKCQNPILPAPKKPVPVRQTNKDPCRGNGKCKQETVPIKAQKVNSSGLASQNPKSISTEVQTSLEGNIGHSNEKVNSLKDSQTTPSTSSVGTQDDKSKSIVSQPPVNPETIVTQTEPLSVQTPPSGELGTPKSELSPHSSVTGDSAPTQLDGQLISSPTQHSPEQEPVSIDKLQEMTSDKNPDQNSPLSANTSDEQDNSANPLGSKDSNDDDTTTETSDSPVLSNTISGDSNSINQVTSDVTLHTIPMGIVLLLSLL
ncbi:hypothetical protein PVT01_000050900, partial [Plasmodium vivax]